MVNDIRNYNRENWRIKNSVFRTKFVEICLFFFFFYVDFTDSNDVWKFQVIRSLFVDFFIKWIDEWTQNNKTCFKQNTASGRDYCTYPDGLHGNIGTTRKIVAGKKKKQTAPRDR